MTSLLCACSGLENVAARYAALDGPTQNVFVAAVPILSYTLLPSAALLYAALALLCALNAAGALRRRSAGPGAMASFDALYAAQDEVLWARRLREASSAWSVQPLVASTVKVAPAPSAGSLRAAALPRERHPGHERALGSVLLRLQARGGLASRAYGQDP